jgi:diguanylate cyclase (GGDEF)-like protein
LAKGCYFRITYWGVIGCFAHSNQLLDRVATTEEISYLEKSGERFGQWARSHGAQSVKKISYARLGLYIVCWVLVAAALSMLLDPLPSIEAFWQLLWRFGILVGGVLLIISWWQSRRSSALNAGAQQGNRKLAFREQMERELTELSTGFINLPLQKIDEAIKHALERVAIICDVDSCSLWLWDDQHRFIKTSIEWHADSVADDNRQWRDMDFGNLPWLKKQLEQGLPVHVLSREQLPEEAAQEIRFCEHFGIRAFAMMPIRFDGKVHGTIGLVVYTDREYWLEPGLAPFQLIADMLSSALQQKSNQQKLMEANAQLQVLSEIDELTGIANRRYFNVQFKNIARQAARTGQLVTLLLVDIDYFKKYNDCYGHVQGDAALRQIAQTVDKSFRRADEHAARYGGEEFTVIFAAGADPAVIYRQSITLRKRIEALHIAHEKSDISDYVTVSIGVACMPITDPEQVGELIELTDECLYRAKSDGRNRVVYRDAAGRLHTDFEPPV